MARSDRGSFGRRPASVRALFAAVIGLLPLTVAFAGPASAAGTAGDARGSATAQADRAARAGGAARAASEPVTIAVTSMTPSYAKPGDTIRITGTLRNNTAATVTGLGMRLTASSYPLNGPNGRTLLEEFAAGTYAPGSRPILNATWPATARKPGASVTLKAGASANWLISVPADSLGLSCFGVYPLTAELTGDPMAGPAIAPIALPFWQTKKSVCAQPKPEPISWIWPLIDQPHQGACPALFDSGLISSLGQGGRLDGLLAAAATYGAAAKVTYAIDPALLENVKTMTAPYSVGGTAGCSGATPKPASQVANDWLKTMEGATAGQPALLTPYADVDMAALTQRGMTSDLGLAFRQGRRVGHDILPATFPGGGAGNATGAASSAAAGRDATAALLGSLAWPADGYANNTLLENLASLNVTGVILDSRTMPAQPATWYTPGAVTTTPDGVGTQMTVLLSDHRLTTLLGSARASSGLPASDFAVSQLFLAETAMISAENTSLSRPVVVAPPRRWNPSPALAKALLSDTASAPWLRPSTPADLVGLPDQPSRRPPQAPSGSQLSGALMRQVAKLDGTVSLVESLTPGNPDLVLYRALFATESSAWRGRQTPTQAWDLLRRSSAYASGQLSGIGLGGARKVILGGTTGSVSISVRNQLKSPVQVRILVSPDNGSIKISSSQLVTVPAGFSKLGSVKIIKLPVQAAQDGSARVRVSLASPDGVALPVRTIVIQVQATQFGTLTLIICAAALAVFVLASAFRAIRAGRPASARPGEADQVPDQGLSGVAEAGLPGEDAGSFGAGHPALTASGPVPVDYGQPPHGYRPTEGSR